jgi:hypothetical protein
MEGGISWGGRLLLSCSPIPANRTAQTPSTHLQLQMVFTYFTIKDVRYNIPLLTPSTTATNKEKKSKYEVKRVRASKE